MAEQNQAHPGKPILDELRIRNARSSLLQALARRKGQMESLELAREMALPACSLVIMSYDSNAPKFLLLFRKRGGKALGPSGTVEGGENPLESLRRVCDSQLGLGGASLRAVSECFAAGARRECHLFVLAMPLQKLRDISGEVNSGKHPDFVLGCVADVEQILGEGANLDPVHSQLAQGIARAERMTA